MSRRRKAATSPSCWLFACEGSFWNWNGEQEPVGHSRRSDGLCQYSCHSRRTFPDGTSVTVSAEPLAGLADSGMISEDLTDLLVAVGEAARSCDSGLLLAIDELQYLTKVDLAAVVGSTHCTVQLGLPVVVAGAGLPQVPALLGEARTYAERLFESRDREPE